MAVAEAIGGTVINADSAQVYRDLRVVTARPSKADEARVPHELFGYIDGGEPCSAARWADDAKAALAECAAAGSIPILTGGTGLYLRTLLEGIAPIPEIDAAIRETVRALPVDEAYAALCAEDPDSAHRLDRTDSSRIARALEVMRSTGRPIGEWRREKTGGISDTITLVPLLLLPDRGWLFERCDRRFAEMFASGAIEEVEALLARELDPSLPLMRAIGVPEIAAFLRGTMKREEAMAAARQSTRRYAKRQFTWFRHQSPSDWQRIDESEYDSNVREMIIKLR